MAKLYTTMIKYKYELLLCLIVPPLLIVRLTSFPPLTFTEGWVLSIARNWAKLGRYCQLMNGAPVSASMLNVGFPAVAPAALSFRLLGVGIWQGRLPFVLFAIGSLMLIHHLSRQLYGLAVARGTIAVLLLMSIGAATNPLVMGRMALGEMPCIFYLLAGYLFFIKSLRRSSFIFVLFTSIFWGLALITKLQPLPFLTASMAGTFLIASFRGSWRLAGAAGASLSGALISFGLMRLIQEALLHSKMLVESQPGIFSVTAFVPVFSVRVHALVTALILAGPALLGMCYTAGGYVRKLRRLAIDELEAARISILIFVATWIAWYLLLSVGAERYIFTPIFLGSIFFALMLYDLTDQFNFRLTLQRAAESMGRKCSRRSVEVLLMLLFVTIAVSLTIRIMISAYARADSSVLDAAKYINTHTRPGSLIETYDMELFFLLRRPYHYPANPMQIKLDRRTYLGEKVSIDYDPLKAHPDYLVVGPQTRAWRLYDPVLKNGAFRLIRTFGPYDIYRRSNEQTYETRPQP